MKIRIRNLLIRILSFLFLPFLPTRTRVRVLALHDITSSQKELFKKKMQWLKTHYNIVPLSDACTRENLDIKKTNVAITFDDGFKCFFSLVAPVLDELSLPATFFIPSTTIGLSGRLADKFTLHNLKRHGDFGFMTAFDILALSKNPLFDIGGHTRNHIDLGKKHSAQALVYEISEDKKILEKLIGKPIHFFAYPFGSTTNVSKVAARAIEDAGYDRAFSILPAFWKTKHHHYFIGRDSLSITDSERLWGHWLSGGYDFLTWVKKISLHTLY